MKRYRNVKLNTDLTLEDEISFTDDEEEEDLTPMVEAAEEEHAPEEVTEIPEEEN